MNKSHKSKQKKDIKKNKIKEKDNKKKVKLKSNKSTKKTEFNNDKRIQRKLFHKNKNIKDFDKLSKEFRDKFNLEFSEKELKALEIRGINVDYLLNSHLYYVKYIKKLINAILLQKPISFDKAIKKDKYIKILENEIVSIKRKNNLIELTIIEKVVLSVVIIAFVIFGIYMFNNMPKVNKLDSYYNPESNQNEINKINENLPKTINYANFNPAEFIKTEPTKPVSIDSFSPEEKKIQEKNYNNFLYGPEGLFYKQGDEYIVNTTSLNKYLLMDYEELKKKFGIKFDFCIVIQQDNTTLLVSEVGRPLIIGCRHNEIKLIKRQV